MQRCEAEQSGVSRRHSTEVYENTEGRAERKGVLNFGELMSNVKKAENSMKVWNYQREAGVELRDSVGEPSIAKVPTRGKDEVKLNPLRTAVCRTARTVV